MSPSPAESNKHKNSFVRACEESFRTVVYDSLGGKRVGSFLGKQTPASRPAPRSPRPVPNPKWYDRVLDSTMMKRASTHWSASRNKETFLAPLINRSSTGRRMVVNRSSAARCVPGSGFHGVSFVRASEELSRTVVFRCPGGQNGRLFPGRIDPPQSWAHPPAAVPSRPAAPRRALPLSACAARLAAVRRPAPSRP